MTRSLFVNEVFRSLQGEGPSTGKPAVFLRLANCNLACVWCDTRYSWDWNMYPADQERHEEEPATVARRLLEHLREVPLLVVTGGEPLLQQPAIVALLENLRSVLPNLRVEIETNGTIAPSDGICDAIDLFVVSPKLSNSAMPEKRRIRLRALKGFPRSKLVLKFVVAKVEDFVEISAIVAAAQVDSRSVWVMPEGTDSETIVRGMKSLSGPAMDVGYSLSTRLHVLLWGDQRGR
ncbi:7-carboxy-7-deazaguanine synthase QueE [Plantibacter flavus]|uniref:7-carboxy-7-deazaguanine synthase QueE n=1 Tax=Plantibacter flavus TaxID=150123 RepID=UPI0010C15FDA|nr:7-carboxy-7-deazaguanine synthase QueE [Plantibacter flavus]TKJ95543.1 7-carboxy-7-deazaguanine synthase QueE [Plantibacter flavus]